jgi:hypothetical protein
LDCEMRHYVIKIPKARVVVAVFHRNFGQL